MLKEKGARSIRSALEKINKQHSSHPVWQGLYQVFSYGLAIFSTTCYTVLGCYTAAETLKKKSLHGISTVLRFASQAADMMGSKLTRNIGVVAEMLPKMERDIDIKMKLFPSHRLTKYIFQYETICQESLTRVPLKALETLEARLRYHPSETLGSTRLSALCDQVGVAEGDVVGRYLAEQLSANNRWINPERIAALTKHLSHRDRLVAESRDPSPAPSHD